MAQSRRTNPMLYYSLIQFLSNLSRIIGRQETPDIIYYLMDADVISF